MDYPAEGFDVDFEAFVSLYIRAIKPQLRSWKEIARRLRRFQERFRGRKVGEIGRADVASYIVERREAGLSNGSINVEISTLSAAYRFAVDWWEWAVRNPVTGLHLRQEEGRLRYLTGDEMRELVKAASGPRIAPHLGYFIRLAVNTGCRKNELLKLRWKQVEFGARRILIEGAISKTGRRRMIPLNDGAFAVMRALEAFRDIHCPNSPWVFCYKDGRRVVRIDKPFWNALARAGIEDFRIHDLRHTFASWLVTEDVSLYHVKELLGHRSINMTERYSHLASSALLRAVAVLDRL